jgi:hypothetical protein
MIKYTRTHYLTGFGHCFFHEVVVIVGGARLGVGGSYRGVFRGGTCSGFFVLALSE